MIKDLKIDQVRLLEDNTLSSLNQNVEPIITKSWHLHWIRRDDVPDAPVSDVFELWSGFRPETDDFELLGTFTPHPESSFSLVEIEQVLKAFSGLSNNAPTLLTALEEYRKQFK